MTCASNPIVSHRGFTLVEILVAMAILVIIVIAMVSMSSSVNRAWIIGEQRVENFQNGRAIMELMSRELSLTSPPRRALGSGTANVSSLQFVQDPNISPLVATSLVTNSSSLFWQAYLAQTSYGNTCEVGYYLINASSGGRRQLQRFFVQPDSLTATSTSTTYKIYNPYTSFTGYTASSPWPPTNAAPWLTTLTAANFQASSSLVSDSVVALWIRCLNVNGDPIPWLKNFDSTASTITYNSAARFRVGSAIPSSVSQVTPNAANNYQSVPTDYQFQYSDTNSIQAQRLPTAVEISIITVDSRAFQRPGANLPAMPSLTGPQDVPAAIQSFNSQLISNNFTSAHTFTNTVRLPGNED